MEKYRVIHNFKDLEDNEHIYIKDSEEKGIYPREGLEPTKKRIKELTSTKNKIGEVLIEKIEDEKPEENNEEINSEETEIIEQVEENKEEVVSEETKE